ncbi:MAG: hypothetical protein IT371_04050 [Deltaproteobacteria bacterium]|nr:hypothetical protein [Deltaproteobacteria bacterium]
MLAKAIVVAALSGAMTLAVTPAQAKVSPNAPQGHRGVRQLLRDGRQAAGRFVRTAVERHPRTLVAAVGTTLFAGGLHLAASGHSPALAMGVTAAGAQMVLTQGLNVARNVFRRPSGGLGVRPVSNPGAWVAESVTYSAVTGLGSGLLERAKEVTSMADVHRYFWGMVGSIIGLWSGANHAATYHGASTGGAR